MRGVLSEPVADRCVPCAFDMQVVHGEHPATGGTLDAQ